jgi:nucleotide-binding universal stress UspA family protein
MKVKKQGQPILVPVDFSPYSEAALVFAADLAECVDKPLLVLHVVHDPGDMPGFYDRTIKTKQLQRIEDAAAEMLSEFLAQVARRYPASEALSGAEPMLVKGLPRNRILEVAEQKKAGMIVMGSKGETGLKHLLLGSVAERVVQLASVPVTVVKTAKK